MVHKLDPSRLVNSASGWNDHGAGEFSDNHHYTEPQCGTPWYAGTPQPFDASRIGFEGEFGGTGHNVSAKHLWKVKDAIRDIGQTYEMYETLDAWNLRGRYILNELRSQIELYSCAGGVWTQATDVEGELNGMLTYDRRILRTDVKQWNADIQVNNFCPICSNLDCLLIDTRLYTMLLHAVPRSQVRVLLVRALTTIPISDHSTCHDQDTTIQSMSFAFFDVEIDERKMHSLPASSVPMRC